MLYKFGLSDDERSRFALDLPDLANLSEKEILDLIEASLILNG